jgi:hypothetical protein
MEPRQRVQFFSFKQVRQQRPPASNGDEGTLPFQITTQQSLNGGSVRPPRSVLTAGCVCRAEGGTKTLRLIYTSSSPLNWGGGGTDRGEDTVTEN